MAQITITNVSAPFAGKPGARWKKITVDYVGDRGPAKKDLMDFNNPDVYKSVQTMVGKTVEVKSVQNEKGFWEWSAIRELEDAPVGVAAPKGATTTFRSDRETPEERAQRQVMIVKQSSLSNAVAFLATQKGATEAQVFELAQRMVDYVIGTDVEEPKTDTSGFDGMESDFPL